MNEIEYALSSESHIAYRIIDGRDATSDLDIVMVAGAFFPFESLEEDRVASRFIDGLASLGRVVVFDKRGVGLSDPFDWDETAQDQWADDVIAVMDAVGMDRASIVSWETMGVGRRVAARHSERVHHLVLVNPTRSRDDLALQFGGPGASGAGTEPVERRAFPTRIDDPTFQEWLSRSGRSGASPSLAPKLWEHLFTHSDELTPAGITAPTMVLHRRDSMTGESIIRAVAESIEGAVVVQVPGADTYPISGDVDPLLIEIARFLSGNASGLAPARQVSAILFTDVVDSTQRAADEGDEAWRDLLDLHDAAVRRCVEQRGGRVVKYTGDGVFALLPSVSAALEVVRSIRDEVGNRGMRLRAGVHVGDVDVRGDDVSGLAVNATARIMGLADADETLVSEPARLAALGSGLNYGARRTTSLKGVPEEWTLSPWLRA